MTPPTMHARHSTLAPGITPCSCRKYVFPDRKKLNATPSATGSSVTSRMFWNMPQASTSISAPASLSTSSGVTMGDRHVLTVVMPTL